MSDSLMLYGEVGWLFAVVSKIADSAAQAPWKIVKMNLDGEKLEVVPTHPAIAMLRAPNPQWTNYDLMSMTQIYLDLCGETFWYTYRNLAGQGKFLWTIPAAPRADSPVR